MIRPRASGVSRCMHSSTQVAVIGGGAAGMGAARRLLEHGVAVTIFEPAPELGGNCTGIEVPRADGDVCSVDVGVSDFNAETFARVRGLLDALGVAYAPICQDAAFVGPDGGTSLFVRAGRVHAHGPDAGALVGEIARFGRAAIAVLDDPAFADWTVDRYLRARGFGEAFARGYLYPRAIGCFAMPAGDPGRFPIQSLVRFWHAHGLVGRSEPPPRMAVLGGMHRYCAALRSRLEHMGAEIRCATRVGEIALGRGGVEIRTTGEAGSATHRFEHVVLATSPGALARMRVRGVGLGAVAAFAQLPTQRARLVVHTDAAFMPRDRDRWGAYNYAVDAAPGTAGPTITFYPKRMRGLTDAAPDVFVTMNPRRSVEPARVIAERWFDHPLASAAGRRLAAQIDRLQGHGNLWFCGSHLREPFLHEQALASGEDVADRLVQVAVGRLRAA